MAEKLDWTEIQSADYGSTNPSNFALSLESVKLLLSLLASRAVYRGAWIVSAGMGPPTPPTPPTDSEWDDIQEFTDSTIRDLMTTFSDVGIIVFWSGVVIDIPAGWVLCDGANGTPDLRGLFVIGSGGAYDPGDTGGSEEKNIQHEHDSGSLSSGTTSDLTLVDDAGVSQSSVPQAGHVHNSFLGSTASAGSTTQDILPPFYSLAFIMRIS